MHPQSGHFGAVLLAVPLLLWPAFYNFYPLVFADTGTYLSQAVERYLGWDRPVFYSLFLLPLHATLTTWPVVIAQSCLAAYTLSLLQRVLLPALPPCRLLLYVAAAAGATALPWFAAQLMPDLFTPLLVIVTAVLCLTPEQLGANERRWLVLSAGFMIATQHSSLLLYPLLAGMLLPLRHCLGAGASLGRRGVLRTAAPLLLAIAALLTVNLAGRGRLTLSPYGNVYLLARMIYDGPALRTLQRDCPQAGWQLCRWYNTLPPDSDAFLWRIDSPARLAGGHVGVAAEANAIIRATLRHEPGAVALSVLRNTGRQMAAFATGDGLQPWPETVDPWIAREFPPREYAAYAAARQARGRLAVPGWMQALHETASVAGVVLCGAILVIGLRRRSVAAGFAAATLLALLINAAIAGSLSAVHDRYQARVMLLPPVVAMLGSTALLRGRT